MIEGDSLRERLRVLARKEGEWYGGSVAGQGGHPLCLQAQRCQKKEGKHHRCLRGEQCPQQGPQLEGTFREEAEDIIDVAEEGL